MSNCNFLNCDVCSETMPTVRDAVIKGWQVRDGLWLCETCLTGGQEVIEFDGTNDSYLYGDDNWLPDAGWC